MRIVWLIVSPDGERGRDDRRSEHQPGHDQRGPATPPSDVAHAELEEDAVAEREGLTARPRARARLPGPTASGPSGCRTDFCIVSLPTRVRARPAGRSGTVGQGSRGETISSVDHSHEPVGVVADGRVVRDDHEGQSVFEVQPAHQLADLRGVLAVEVARGLVGPDDRRVVDEGARDRHALALAARELVRDVLGASRRSRRGRGRPSALRRASFARTRATSSGSSTFSTAVSTGIRL